MNIKAFLFTCCAALLVTTADAKRPVKIVTPPASEQTQPSHQLMHQRVSELMADRVGFKKDMIDKLIEMEEMEELEAMEDLEFSLRTSFMANGPMTGLILSAAEKLICQILAASIAPRLCFR